MPDDIRELVHQAVLEVEDGPPVEDILCRARRRRHLRRGLAGAAGVALLALAMIAVTGLAGVRIDLAPAGPQATPALKARFEVIDFDYTDVLDHPTTPLPFDVVDVTGTQTGEWAAVTVRSGGLRYDGGTLMSDQVDELRAVPEELFVPGREQAAALPGRRVADDDADVRRRVAADLGLDPQELRAVVTEELFCGRQVDVDGACPQPHVRIERTFVHHAPTGLPLYRAWRPDGGMPTELAARDLDELVELRATDLRITGGSSRGEGLVLEVPPEGQAAPEWLPDGTPVYVVNDADGWVHVVEAVNPHAPHKIARPVAWCPEAGFQDLAYESLFGPDGRYAGGPSPSDLVTYRNAPGATPGTVEVLDRVVPQGRAITGHYRGTYSCSGGILHDADPVRGRVYRPSEAVRESPAGWILVDGTVGVDRDGRVWACDGDPGGDTPDRDGWRCPTSQVPMSGIDTAGSVDQLLWGARPQDAVGMWVVVTDDGLQRPPHPLIDRLPDAPEPGEGPAPRAGDPEVQHRGPDMDPHGGSPAINFAVRRAARAGRG